MPSQGPVRGPRLGAAGSPPRAECAGLDKKPRLSASRLSSPAARTLSSLSTALPLHTELLPFPGHTRADVRPRVHEAPDGKPLPSAGPTLSSARPPESPPRRSPGAVCSAESESGTGRALRSRWPVRAARPPLLRRWRPPLRACGGKPRPAAPGLALRGKKRKPAGSHERQWEDGGLQ